MDSRRKGKRGEREWVAYLRSLGIQARRVPLSGSAPDYSGDVDSVIPGVGRVLWQVKLRRAFPKWLGVDSADAVVFRTNRGEWHVLMPVGLWQAIVCRPGGDDHE